MGNEMYKSVNALFLNFIEKLYFKMFINPEYGFGICIRYKRRNFVDFCFLYF